MHTNPIFIVTLVFFGVIVASVIVLKSSRFKRFESLVELLLNIKKEIQRDSNTTVFMDTGTTPVFLQFSMSEDIMGAFEYVQDLLREFQYEVHCFNFNPSQEEITFHAVSEDYEGIEDIKFFLTYTFCKRKEGGENKYRLSAK